MGAGPGVVGLLTLKAKRVLERAVFVVYDAMVGAGSMALFPSTAACIYVGKRSSHPN